MSRTSILVNATENGNTKFGFNGGLGLLLVWGVFDKADVALNISPLDDDDSILIPVLDSSGDPVEFSEDGCVGFFVAPGFDYYLVITGVDTLTDINADVSDASGIS